MYTLRNAELSLWKEFQRNGCGCSLKHFLSNLMVYCLNIFLPFSLRDWVNNDKMQPKQPINKIWTSQIWSRNDNHSTRYFTLLKHSKGMQRSVLSNAWTVVILLYKLTTKYNPKDSLIIRKVHQCVHIIFIQPHHSLNKSTSVTWHHITDCRHYGWKIYTPQNVIYTACNITRLTKQQNCTKHRWCFDVKKHRKVLLEKKRQNNQHITNSVINRYNELALVFQGYFIKLYQLLVYSFPYK
jgi:hypothetical protein